jgi:squalene-hopene/tetraprenyl-beta-curcumene cyclase
VSALGAVRGVQGSGFRVQGADFDGLICRGVAWLVARQNDDGGFGDTDLSYSNIATTYLVVAALHLAGIADRHAELIRRANAYIDTKGRLEGLRARYGIDKTFVVPIMTNLALAGLVDWGQVDPLPFELACVPQSLYRFVGMPVVSYAIPALVAIGQARYFHLPPRNPVARLIRALSVQRSLKILRRMQPDSGGYLEATPLTSFVAMSLAGTRLAQPSTAGSQLDQVLHDGVKFLVNSVRPDGSWPIDTNLATWNTTLAINALAGAGENVAELLGAACLDWLLSCQHLKRHSFTGANPGGFGWSDLPGAVPDADDTAGALLALHAWRQLTDCTQPERQRIEGAVLKAIVWLFGLQNHDGGWPTFCRGWGRLPFDRSGTDLTAHVLRALCHWPIEPDKLALLSTGQSTKQFDETDRWLWYPKSHQRSDGSWSPLWFGNQDHPNEENPVYGTSKVLMAYRDLDWMDVPEARAGITWLVANQNADGGWGNGVWRPECSGRSQKEEQGDWSGVEPSLRSEIPNLKSSIEETALAVEALLAAMDDPAAAGAVNKGLAWLIERVEQDEHRQPAPIGFYFAKLWYYERLYPLTFTVAALGRACRTIARPQQPDPLATTAASRSP